MYSIGSFNFIALSRPGGRGEGPELLGEEAAILTRDGVDGVNVRKSGMKGRPFQMRSSAVFQTLDSALLAHVNYRLSQSLAGDIVWEGVSYQSAYGVAYIVLHVSEPIMQKLGASISYGQDVTGWWKIDAIWDLMPVDENHLP